MVDLLERFCFHVPMRYPVMSAPFRVGDWVYAGDDRILVRRRATDEPPGEGRLPPVDDLFAGFPPAGEWQRWPAWDGHLPEEDDVPIIARQTLGNGEVIDGLLWLVISSLGDVAYCLTPMKSGAIAFRAVLVGVEGVVMPRRKEVNYD